MLWLVIMSTIITQYFILNNNIKTGCNTVVLNVISQGASLQNKTTLSQVAVFK